MPKKKKKAEPKVEATLNEVKIHYRESDRYCSIIVNGVEIAGMIERGVELFLGVDERGDTKGHLAVRYGL